MLKAYERNVGSTLLYGQRSNSETYPSSHFHKFLIFIEKAAGVDIRCLAAELLDGNDGAKGSKDYEEIIKRVTASAYTGESRT